MKKINVKILKRKTMIQHGMCKNSDYVLLLRSDQFYPTLYALQISTMRIRCYVILNTTNCFIKHQCTNETTISVYRSDTKTETQIGRYFADTVTDTETVFQREFSYR